MLAEMEKNRGGLLRGNIMLPRDDTPTLAELGLTRLQSSRYQQLAGVPKPSFLVLVIFVRENGGLVIAKETTLVQNVATRTHQTRQNLTNMSHYEP